MRGKLQYANTVKRLKSRLHKQSLPTQTGFKRVNNQYANKVKRLKSRLHKQSLPTQTGFTLFELIIIVTIIGILAAIAFPNWQRFVERQRLNTAQNQVYLALRSAQSEAKLTKANWQASFRENNGVVQWAIHPATANLTTVNWNSLDSEIQIDQETTYKLLSNGIRRVEFGFMGEVKTIPLGRFTLSSKQSGQIKRCVFVSTILGALRTAKENPTQKDGKYCY